MELDKTQIVVRERGTLETYDLALHVLREHAGPLIGLSLIAIVPLMAVNYWLTGWILADVSGLDEDDMSLFVRYFWTLSMMMFIQAPLVSIFTTVYLGHAVFNRRPSWRTVIREVAQHWHRLLWRVIVLRGVMFSFLFALLINRFERLDIGYELLGLGGVALVAGIWRGARPFLVEILLLEKNPLRSRDKRIHTVNKRSSLLHGGSSDFIGAWLMSLLVGAWFWTAIWLTIVAVTSALDNNTEVRLWQLTFGIPFAYWLAQIYLGVAKFLMYLATRIRQEGWEVELLLKAERNRLPS